MHPVPFTPPLFSSKGCPSSSPHHSPQACPGLSACLLHHLWAPATTNPPPSRSGSPFPASVQDPGLHLWRVEKLKPVPVAPENQGIFFSGDSYLVLHNGPEELSDLHLWIGK